MHASTSEFEFQNESVRTRVRGSATAFGGRFEPPHDDGEASGDDAASPESEFRLSYPGT
jgi:hypothetical protein